MESYPTYKKVPPGEVKHNNSSQFVNNESNNMTVRRNKDRTNGATLICSEEELTVLWHKLNASAGIPFTEYVKSEGLPDNVIRNINGEMWEDLDRKFRPVGQ